MFPFREQERRSEDRERLLRELTYIELHTRRIARNSLLGYYRSRLRGEGLDFVEHKQYVPGDNYRRFDWNVVARTRRPHVKICYEEKEMTALIVADLSGSMNFGSEQSSKKDVLIETAAALAFSAAAENISVALVAGTDHVELYQRPRRGRRHVWRVLDSLLDLRPSSKRTNLPALLKFGQERLRHPCLFFVLSDFIVMESVLYDPLLSSIAAHHDLVPVLIEDKLERNLPAAGGYVRLRDMEGRRQAVLSLSPANCAVFARSMQERETAIRRAFLRLGVIPVVLQTGQSPLQPLMKFFLERKRQ